MSHEPFCAAKALNQAQSEANGLRTRQRALLVERNRLYAQEQKVRKQIEQLRVRHREEAFRQAVRAWLLFTDEQMRTFRYDAGDEYRTSLLERRTSELGGATCHMAVELLSDRDRVLEIVVRD